MLGLRVCWTEIHSFPNFSLLCIIFPNISQAVLVLAMVVDLFLNHWFKPKLAKTKCCNKSYSTKSRTMQIASHFAPVTNADLRFPLKLNTKFKQFNSSLKEAKKRDKFVSNNYYHVNYIVCDLNLLSTRLHLWNKGLTVLHKIAVKCVYKCVFDNKAAIYITNTGVKRKDPLEESLQNKRIVLSEWFCIFCLIYFHIYYFLWKLLFLRFMYIQYWRIFVCLFTDAIRFTGRSMIKISLTRHFDSTDINISVMLLNA